MPARIKKRVMGKSPTGRIAHAVICRTYGDCLYWHRVSRRLSQRDLCKLAGNRITQQALGQLEKGNREPLWATACMLADALNLPLDSFRVDRPGPRVLQGTQVILPDLSDPEHPILVTPGEAVPCPNSSEPPPSPPPTAPRP